MNPKNIAASVRARLANHARQTNRPHQEVLQYYAMERLLWLLATTFEFDGATLADAVRATFTTRDTIIDSAPLALSSEFIDAPNTRANWAAFVRRLQLAKPANDMRAIVQVLRDFLLPALAASATSVRFDAAWKPGGPWR